MLTIINKNNQILKFAKEKPDKKNINYWRIGKEWEYL